MNEREHRAPWLSDAEISEIVSRVSFCAMLGHADAKLSAKINKGTVTLRLEAQLPDRDFPAAVGPLVMTLNVIQMAFQDERMTLLHIRRLLLDFVKHEAEESFLFRNRRILDPHADEERARSR